MYDIRPLEDNWKKYQAKKRKPIYFFLSLIVIISIVLALLFIKSSISWNFFTSWYENKNIHQESKENIPFSSNSRDKKILINMPLNRLEVVENTSSIASFSKEDSIPVDVLVDIPILDKDDESFDNEAVTKKVHLNIIETSSISAYQDVENRFKQSHDVDDALFLAKSYYKKGNYQKSLQWALETNKLDDSIEESFLIFVKSKMKLGQRNEVISLLNSYLTHSDSVEVKNLLYKIENNKF